MHILYAADENYARHAAASMVSLMENNRGADITVHFLSMGTSRETLERLKNLCEGKYGCTFSSYERGDTRRWFDFPVNTRGFAPSALARLFVASVLPEDIDRVLYLDCDTVVLESLDSLWRTDMGRCVLGMVAEPTVTKKRRVQLGMPTEQPYFNSGVLLIDLKRWRQEDVEKTVLDYYCMQGGDLVAPDQDALNGALVGRIWELQPRYNYGSVQIYYPWRAQKRISAPTPFMSEEEYRRGTEKPAIVHFLGEERPWRAGNHHPYAPAYDRYLSLTPWKDTPKDEGWRMYFRLFGLFNAVTRPVPLVRYKIIDALIPAFMRRREKQLRSERKQ